MAKTKKEPERYDRSWRDRAKSGFEVAMDQLKQAMHHLDHENDYSAQIHGHSALKHCAEALSDIAAAIERKPKGEK
jgi:uncharacterized protein YukE